MLRHLHSRSLAHEQLAYLEKLNLQIDWWNPIRAKKKFGKKRVKKLHVQGCEQDFALWSLVLQLLAFYGSSQRAEKQHLAAKCTIFPSR